MSTTLSHPTALATGTWAADPVHSSIGFALKHLGVSTFRGSFDDAQATLAVGADNLQLHGHVAVANVSVKQPDLRGHLLSPEFFDAERYPQIEFASDAIAVTADGQLTVDGRLTIRGHSEPITAHGTLGQPSEGMGGEQRVSVALQTVVDRTAFGLNWNAELPNGKRVINDEVTITVDLEMVRADEEA